MKIYSHPGIPAYTGFIYIWMNPKTKKFYLGSHQGHKDDGYTGSGTKFKPRYDENPQDFKRRIIQFVCGTHDDLLDAEEKWLLQIKPNELYGKKYYNCTRNARYVNSNWGKSYSTITDGVTEKRLYDGEDLPDGWSYGRNPFVDNSNTGSLGRIKITDGLIERFIKPEDIDDIPDGWYLGRHQGEVERLQNFRHTEESKEAIRLATTGVKHSTERVQKQKDTKQQNENRWYTNGVEEGQFSKFETVPDGWYLGRYERNWDTKSGSKGRIKISDGTNEKYVMSSEDVPEGWYIGRAESVRKSMLNNKGQTGRMVINNGIDEKFLNKGAAIPSGWKVGRISSSVRGKMIINNGIEQIYIFRANSIPEGWTRGRAPKDSK